MRIVAALITFVLLALAPAVPASAADDPPIKGLFLLTDYPAVSVRPGATSTISLRLRNFNSERLKVNDQRGNPIEIAAAVVWCALLLAPPLFTHREMVGDVGEMASVMAGLAKDFPASDLNRIYVTKPLVETVVGDLSSILLIVFSATALLLVLACVNVTNLLLARGADPNVRLVKGPPVGGYGTTATIGATPFLLAAASADVSLMRVLVEGRANPKLVAVDGSTPLMVAAGLARERVSKNLGMTPETELASLEAVKMAIEDFGGKVNGKKIEFIFV